ncbi:Crp/Fnr family transcriptional regulator [Corynebacterium breve]|uniref:Crp/Fnr family transcriptional regulator n=1 Tax=Corynebacterium breve TaxID=3049799 RepID=A0ABY8VG86_9CORY|nr:Crp/Fnr family transcriptional regulator [Corynebacterium breve]WIM67780.1 Crp/Fnr family transcriptional regulator [Corynebacterium breve]
MARNPVRHNCAQPHQCSFDVRMKVLARSPLTKYLTPEEHQALDAHLTAWAWAEGDPIMMTGEEVTGSYMIASGRARITHDTSDGRELTVDIAVPGDLVGPLSTGPAPATETAWAMETTCALYFSGEALGTIVEKHPQLAVSILSKQQTRIAQLTQRKAGLVSLTVEQRVAAALLYLDGKLGQKRRDGSSLLQVRLRRDDIAGLAGTTVESASRALTKMKKEGLIDSGREWISLVDNAALERLASGLSAN